MFARPNSASPLKVSSAFMTQVREQFGVYRPPLWIEIANFQSRGSPARHSPKTQAEKILLVQGGLVHEAKGREAEW